MSDAGSQTCEEMDEAIRDVLKQARRGLANTTRAINVQLPENVGCYFYSEDQELPSGPHVRVTVVVQLAAKPKSLKQVRVGKLSF